MPTLPGGRWPEICCTFIDSSTFFCQISSSCPRFPLSSTFRVNIFVSVTRIVNPKGNRLWNGFSIQSSISEDLSRKVSELRHARACLAFPATLFVFPQVYLSSVGINCVAVVRFIKCHEEDPNFREQVRLCILTSVKRMLLRLYSIDRCPRMNWNKNSLRRPLDNSTIGNCLRGARQTSKIKTLGWP